MTFWQMHILVNYLHTNLIFPAIDYLQEHLYCAQTPRKKDIILLTDLVSSGAVHEGKSFARRHIDPLVSEMFIIHEEHRVVVIQD